MLNSMLRSTIELIIDFTHCSIVCIVKLEQLNAGWILHPPKYGNVLS